MNTISNIQNGDFPYQQKEERTHKERRFQCSPPITNSRTFQYFLIITNSYNNNNKIKTPFLALGLKINCSICSHQCKYKWRNKNKLTPIEKWKQTEENQPNPQKLNPIHMIPSTPNIEFSQKKKDPSSPFHSQTPTISSQNTHRNNQRRNKKRSFFFFKMEWGNEDCGNMN